MHHAWSETRKGDPWYISELLVNDLWDLHFNGPKFPLMLWLTQTIPAKCYPASFKTLTIDLKTQYEGFVYTPLTSCGSPACCWPPGAAAWLGPDRAVGDQSSSVSANHTGIDVKAPQIVFSEASRPLGLTLSSSLPHQIDVNTPDTASGETSVNPIWAPLTGFWEGHAKPTPGDT